MSEPAAVRRTRPRPRTTWSAGVRPARLHPWVALLAAVALALPVLGACAGGSDSSESSAAGGSVADGGSGGAAGDAAGGDVGEPAGDASLVSARLVSDQRDIIYRGSVTVRVDDVRRAADRAESVVAGVGGVVFSEETMVEPGRLGYGEARLVLRVPPEDFGPTLDALAALGKESNRSRSAKDVTAQVTDVDSRIRSQERSVARVRALLDEAATVGEVVEVEAELAEREADLESLQAQLARLREVTDLATIEVTFTADPRAELEREPSEALGFLSGLGAGWEALVSSVAVGLTVLGALLPFAVVLALVGVPAYALLRRRRTTSSAASTEPVATPSP